MTEVLKKQKRSTRILDLGLIDFDQAYTTQQRCIQEALTGEFDFIILCEHPPVLTMGRLSNEKNILVSLEEIKQKGVTIKHIDRGGDITLHAPGQLVAYPVLNLNNRKKDLHYFLHQLEEVVIALLTEFDIVGKRHHSQTGVWVAEQKIASIGIGVKKWVSYHGLALNVNTDLTLFHLIKPCGLDVTMTSVAALKRNPIAMREVKQRFLKHFGRVFNDE